VKRRAVAVATALILGVALASARAEGAGLNLHLVDGGVWHSTNPFMAQWDPPPSDPVAHWQILRADGTPMQPPISGDDTERWSATKVSVPPVPGIYLLEVQVKGITETVRLPFDNARPGQVPIEAPTWVTPGSEVPIRLSQPAGTLPISGIHGYAVSIDGAAAASPCADADVCKAAEINLPEGPTDTSAILRAPAEGVAYLHAAAVSGSGMRSITSTRSIGIDGTPPAIRLEGESAGWADGPVRLSALATDPLSGTAPAGPGGPVTALGIDGLAPVLTPGPAASALVVGEGVHGVVFWARDALGNSGDGSSPFDQPGTAVVRIDETGPDVRFAAPDPGDPERIEATVTDGLSGADPDRGSIAVRRAGSSGPFQPLPTNARRGRLVARWNSDDFPHGPYEFRATGFDTAGNSTASTAAAGGGAFVLQDPVKREARLAFGFGAERLVFQRCTRADGGRRCHRTVVASFAKRPPARTVPCCHGALVGGRLVDLSGAPLAGQTVEVVEAFAARTRNPARRTVLTTDADGRFSTRLAPGPSRVVSAEFPGTGRLTHAAGRSLRLRVRAAVHLRVSTPQVEVGGAPVVFSGRIAHPEAPIPVTGLPVQLEFRLPGVPWTQFRTVQSDATGSFRFPYSFSDDDSAGVRFLFRAFVPATGNWPFAPATSRPVAVTG
jgi:hypothetical protein